MIYCVIIELSNGEQIEKEQTVMKSKVETITMNKGTRTFKVYADYIMRGMYAEDENGTVKCIKGSGYLNNELSIRKAIANAFGLESFRK